MKALFRVLLLIVFVVLGNNIFADDTSIDQVRFEKLTSELRCLVCQNETLADSTAPLAVDLKKEIYIMMQQGKTDPEIIHYLLQRYGEFVLFKPSFSVKNYILWFGPFMLLIGALAWLVLALRQRNIKKKHIALSDEEKQRLEQLLK